MESTVEVVNLDAAFASFTVPRGMRHRPRAAEDTRFLMFEPRGTVDTGDPATGTAGVRLES